MIGNRDGVRIGISTGSKIGLGTDLLVPSPPTRKLVIVAGQSNASGQQGTANITNSQRKGIGSSYSRVNLRQKLSQPAPAGDPIVWTTDYAGPLISYTATQDNVSGHGIDGTGLGPVLALGRHLDYYLSKFDMCCVAESGASLAVHWNPTGTYPETNPSNLFYQMVNVVNGACQQFGASVAAFVWIQGESDASDSTQAANYQTNLTALFATVRAQWPGVAIVFNQLSNSYGATWTSTVRTAQANVAAGGGCTMINVDDIVLGDSQHFNADGCAAVGDRFGSAIVTALSLASPVSWSIDPYSLIGVPNTEAEVIAMLAAAGVTWPGGNMALYRCQDASGNLTDSSNAAVFGMTAAGTTITYQASNAAWSRKAVNLSEGGTATFSTTSASLPDPSTTGQARIAYGVVGNAATLKNLWIWGTGGLSVLQRTANGTGWDLVDGANTVTQSGDNITAQVRPIIESRRVVAAAVDAYTDNAHLPGTIGAVTGKKTTFGGSGTPSLSLFWCLDLFGATAELTAAQVRTILQTLNWGNANIGATAIPW